MDSIKPKELHKALGAFLMVFGTTLPPQMKEHIRQQAYALAEQIEANGEPTVATLTRELADALLAVPPPANH